MSKEIFEHHGGSGYDYSEEYGVFEVKYSTEKGEEVKDFLLLTEARSFYDKLICDKEIWDLSFIPDLLDSHTLIKKENK